MARAVDPTELDDAIRAALAGRKQRPLTFGQQVVLEALAGFDDDRLTAAAHTSTTSSAISPDRGRAALTAAPA